MAWGYNTLLRIFSTRDRHTSILSNEKEIASGAENIMDSCTRLQTELKKFDPETKGGWNQDLVIIMTHCGTILEASHNTARLATNDKVMHQEALQHLKSAIGHLEYFTVDTKDLPTSAPPWEAQSKRIIAELRVAAELVEK